MPDDSPLGPDDPRRLGDYVLVRRLGEGGRRSGVGPPAGGRQQQSVAYLGRADDGELVTIKLLRGTSARARARFRREAEAARRVASPRVARVLDTDIAGDRPYIVSEFVEGPTLRQVVEDRGPLSGAQLTRLALRTAVALAAIHRAGVVHRGLTPGTVLLGPDGAKVIDLGVAQVADGTPMAARPPGAIAYMAPEQFEDGPAGTAADVFAWAATVTYAASGRPPFGTGSAATVRRIRTAEPDLSGLPGPLRRVVADCLAKSPMQRPTAPQLVQSLRRRPRQGRQDQPAGAARTVPERHFGWRMFVALAVVVVAGLLVGLLLPVPS